MSSSLSPHAALPASLSDFLRQDDSGAAQQAAAYLSPLVIAIAAALLLLNGLVSLWMSLGLHKKIAMSALRCAIQLTVLGYILEPIFAFDAWWLVVIICICMLLISAAEAVSHPTAAYQGMLLHVLGAVGVSSAAVLTYALLLVVHPTHFLQAQYAIPVLGMLLGNCISGVSIGLAAVMEEVTRGRDKVELLMCLGANRWEATRSLRQRCLTAALTQQLNQMGTMGLVTIPGMMNGMMLSGTSPVQAARYQIALVFLISVVTCLGAAGSVHLAVLVLLDRKRQRLCSERIVPRTGRGTGVAQWVSAQTVWGLHAAYKGTQVGLRRLRLVWSQRARLFRRGKHPFASVQHQQNEDDDAESTVSSRLREVIIGQGDNDSMSYAPSGVLSDGDAPSELPLLDTLDSSRAPLFARRSTSGDLNASASFGNEQQTSRQHWPEPK